MKTKSKKQNGKPGQPQLNAPTTEAWLKRISGSSPRQPVKPGNGARVMLDWEDENGNNVPMLLLPLTEAAHEARVEAGAKAIAAAEGWLDNWDSFLSLRREALRRTRINLRAIGDVPVKMEARNEC